MSYCTGIHKKNYSIDLKTNKKYYIYRSITKATYEVLKDFILSLVSTKKRKRTHFLIRPFLFLKKLIIKSPSILINLATRIKKFRILKSLPELHTNGCGDFTLD